MRGHWFLLLMLFGNLKGKVVHSPFWSLKSSGMSGALWVIDAPCSTIESIQEFTIEPIDCNLATPSLQFPEFGEFQGISLLSLPIRYTKKWLLGAEKRNSCPTAWNLKKRLLGKQSSGKLFVIKLAHLFYVKLQLRVLIFLRRKSHVLAIKQLLLTMSH